MSLEATRRMIEGRLIANTDIPIIFEGQVDKIAPPCLLLFIDQGESFQASFGAPSKNIVRTSGRATIRVLTEGGKGATEANRIVDMIIPVFTNFNEDMVADDGTRFNLQFDIPEVRSINDETEPFYRLDISVPFRRDEYRA